MSASPGRRRWHWQSSHHRRSRRRGRGQTCSERGASESQRRRRVGACWHAPLRHTASTARHGTARVSSNLHHEEAHTLQPLAPHPLAVNRVGRAVVCGGRVAAAGGSVLRVCPCCVSSDDAGLGQGCRAKAVAGHREEGGRQDSQPQSAMPLFSTAGSWEGERRRGRASEERERASSEWSRQQRLASTRLHKELPQHAHVHCMLT